MVLTDIGCLHAIQVINVNDNEIFYFPIILIKGCITGNCHNCESVKNIAVHRIDECAVVKDTLHCLDRDKFKILVYLKEGRNSFMLQCCSIRKELVLFLELPISVYVVKPLYVICKDHNGLFQAPEGCDNSIESARKRIGVCAKLLQTIFAEKLYEHGYDRKTFQLDTECVTFYTNLTINDVYSMSPHEIWQYLGREIMTSSIGSTHCKFLAFLSCTIWNDNTVDAHVALGGGGLALFGTCYLYTWPTTFDEILNCFLNNAKIDAKHFMDNDNFRGTYGACFSATLGAVCHELGHAFDLGHTRGGVMGSGYFDVDSIFTFEHFHNNDIFEKNQAIKSTTISCMRNHNRKVLILPMDRFTQELNISYCVPLVSRIANNKSHDLTKRIQEPSKNDILLHQSFPSDRLYFTYSCATLISYHRWFNISFINDGGNNFKYDSNRGIVRSLAGIVVVQLRDDEGYVLRSWEFSSANNNKKNLFLVPLRELRRANVIFIEDAAGNIIKEDIPD